MENIMSCCGGCGGEKHEPVKNQDEVEEKPKNNEET